MGLKNSIQFIRAVSKIAVKMSKNKILGQKMDDVAQRYILSAMTEMGSGLTAKAAQVLSAKNLNGKIDLDDLLMNEEEVSSILQNNEELWNELSVFSFDGIPGSLGEVHKGVLKNGMEVAVKLQYPEVESKINGQLNILLNAMGFVAKLNSTKFKYNEYLSLFKKNLNDEVNYFQELENQLYFYKNLLNFEDIIIPNIYSQYTTRNILVQDWIKFTPLDQLDYLSQETKSYLANYLLEIFLYQFMNLHKIHGDFHYGNMGVTLSQPYKLVLLDFGSVLDISTEHMNTLMQVIYFLRNNIAFNALDIFEKLGFNKDSLLLIEDKLERLIRIILFPFVTKEKFDPSQWDFLQQSQDLLGPHRMLFRMSGPPWFLLLMRTFSGLTSCFKLFSSKINSNLIVEKYINEFIKISSIEFIKSNKVKEITLNNMIVNVASFLCVQMIENGKEKVYIEMPAISYESLEDIIPDNIKDKIINLGYNIQEMKEKILSSSMIPQLIFELKIDSREIKIWLK
ncbi:AarF/UbiB family protein [Silvanigrella aquatica]|uniref:ABC1 atypical kinase-like domain-containing protein n=1 Tax=Silvanigrella aquatica TaxID=1915309 RepID=A0A1L4CYW7_9BACT|nr:AarF/ABC1/UbiB kinase family protein [Silvanigrella aquatica]APJ03130.1 hypothetical protein AXG55_04095 [Silvanigrella aquatica]